MKHHGSECSVPKSKKNSNGIKTHLTPTGNQHHTAIEITMYILLINKFGNFEKI